MKPLYRNLLACLVCALVLMFVIGCGGKEEGTTSYQGQPGDKKPTPAGTAPAPGAPQTGGTSNASSG